MPSLGLGYDELEKVNPHIVMTSISNFGQYGPYRDFKASELIIYGMGGAMYSCGLPEKEPQKLAGTFVLYEAGIAAANASLAALFVSELQGEGQHVDVAITEAIASGVDRLHTNLMAYSFNQEVQPRLATFLSSAPGTGAYPCKDGYVDLVLTQMRYLERTRNLLGHPDFLEDPKWEDPTVSANPELRDEFNAFYLSWLSDKTKNEVSGLAANNGILGAPLNTIEDVLNDPHFSARKTFIEIDHPMTGPLNYATRPFRMSETPWQMRRPAPLLGEHNEEVYGEIGYSKNDLVHLREQGVI
jgi:crotonobetainyl-CoA:carnitine CoA-transferase CaiB-like acyl-CoA transferase